MEITYKNRIIEDHIGYESSPLTIHNKRVQFLDTMSVLMDCTEDINGQLPDGKRPDVIKVNSQKKILFIGDAKNTESPNNMNTQVRLLDYLAWLSANSDGEGRFGIFAICLGRYKDIDGWIRTIMKLGKKVGIYFNNFRVEEYAQNLIVIWFFCNMNNIIHKNPLFGKE